MEYLQNHLIDPTYFWDAIEEFSFNYNIYVLTSKEFTDDGKLHNRYELQTIRGSLQSHGTELHQRQEGNLNVVEYNFYCKSLYRINIGDVIEYKNKYLLCKSVHDYDEHGVRSAALSMIQLSAYRDLRDYIEYIRGIKIV